MKGNKNIFSEIPDAAKQEIFEEILSVKDLRIERIVSSGQVSPEDFWYDQEENEWVILLQGEAKIAFKDREEVCLKSGDYLFLPAHQKHRVSFTSVKPQCVWLALFWRS